MSFVNSIVESLRRVNELMAIRVDQLSSVPPTAMVTIVREEVPS